MLAALNWASVAVAGMMVLGIAFCFVVILSVAYARLKVEQDPKVEAVLNALPGANCGGCGLAGCGAYAEGVVADHALLGKCGPGGEELVHALAAILGIEASTAAPVRPVVHCSAHTADMINGTSYHGINSCAEAHMVAGVIGCSYGCMGLGDCQDACDFDAINIVDGLATVDYSKCVGCGACVKACPRNIIEMVSLIADPLLVVGCSSKDSAKDVRGYCKVGCVGCTLCVKQAPGVFKMQDGIAAIDYENYGSDEDRAKAVEKCPRALLVYVGQNAAKPAPTEKPQETPQKA